MFKHMLIRISLSIAAFKEICRPFIGNRCLSSKRVDKGVLLIGIVLDGNNGQFPLTYAVVEKENKHEWSFSSVAS